MALNNDDNLAISFRFSQFFLKPLFTESATGREVNAVNSENDKNIQNDAWRIHQLEKSTADPQHPYSKFGTGKHFIVSKIEKLLVCLLVSINLKYFFGFDVYCFVKVTKRH